MQVLSDKTKKKLTQKKFQNVSSPNINFLSNTFLKWFFGKYLSHKWRFYFEKVRQNAKLNKLSTFMGKIYLILSPTVGAINYFHA